MNYADFIPARGDDALRTKLWEHYQALQNYFQNDLGFTATVHTVREIPRAETPHHFAGTIAIHFDPAHEGAIFHELTHNLFEHSVFHRLHDEVNAFPEGRCQDPVFNETWGEGFCDAIRWLMESVRVPQSDWLRRYPGRIADDWRKDRAERILGFAGRSLSAFAAAWMRLTTAYDGTADYLNRSVR